MSAFTVESRSRASLAAEAYLREHFRGRFSIHHLRKLTQLLAEFEATSGAETERRTENPNGGT